MLRFLLLVFGAFCAVPCLKADEPVIRFDGVRFSGMWYYGTQNEEEIAAQFPVGYRFGDRREIREDGYSVEVPSELTGRMTEALQAEMKPGGERLVDRLARAGEGSSSREENAWLVACAINYEHIETQELPFLGGKVTKILTEVGFDVILCNFADRRIAALLPGRLQLTDAVKGTEVSEERKRANLERLYGEMLLPEFMRIMKQPCSAFSPSFTIGIGEIALGEELLRDTPASVRPSVYSYYSSLISAAFYEKLGVPVLPFSGGNDQVYCSMRENLADVHELKRRAAMDTNDARREGNPQGAVFVLKRPDCLLRIALPKFKTQVVRSVNKRQNELAFVAGCEISLLDPAGRTAYQNRVLGHVADLYTKDVKLGTPWIYYQAASWQMLANAADEMKQDAAARKWLLMSSVDSDKMLNPSPKK